MGGPQPRLLNYFDQISQKDQGQVILVHMTDPPPPPPKKKKSA